MKQEILMHLPGAAGSDLHVPCQALFSMKAVFIGGFSISNAENRFAMESASYMCKPDP